MCGRAYETYTDKELNARYIRGAPTADDIQQLILMPEPVYNLCPTMNSPVLRVVDGSRRLDLMHWQLIPRDTSRFSRRSSPRSTPKARPCSQVRCSENWSSGKDASFR